MDDFDKIAQDAWEAPDEIQQTIEELFAEEWNKIISEGERLLDIGVVGWDEGDPCPTFLLYDSATGLPDPCKHCGKTDDWVCEGAAFVCEHGVIVTTMGCARVHDTRAVVKQTRRPELSGRFRCQRLHLYDEPEDESTWDRKQ